MRRREPDWQGGETRAKDGDNTAEEGRKATADKAAQRRPKNKGRHRASVKESQGNRSPTTLTTMKKITAIIVSAMLAIAALACSGGEATSRPTATETPATTSATATETTMTASATATPTPATPDTTKTPNPTATETKATPDPTATLDPTIAPTPTAEPAPSADPAKALECMKEFQNLMFGHEPDELRTKLDTEGVQTISRKMAASSEACQQAGWDPVFATELAEPCTKGDIIGSHDGNIRILRSYFYTQEGKRIHTKPTLVLISRDETTGGPSIAFLIHFEKLPFSNDSGCWYNDFRNTYFYIRASSGNVLHEFPNFEFADTPEIREALGLETS